MIHIGDPLPSVSVYHLAPDADQPTCIPMQDLLGDKSVILFGLPGAYTSTCSSKHLPDFISRRAEFTSRGIDLVACISVNDPYVMKAWGELHHAEPDVMMLADPSGAFHRECGLLQTLDLLGGVERARRYSMWIKGGKVKAMHVDEEGAMRYKVSGPSPLLKELDQEE